MHSCLVVAMTSDAWPLTCEFSYSCLVRQCLLRVARLPYLHFLPSLKEKHGYDGCMYVCMYVWRHHRSQGHKYKSVFDSFFQTILHGVTSAVIRAYLRYVQYIPICCLSLSLTIWFLKNMAALSSFAHTWLPGF